MIKKSYPVKMDSHFGTEHHGVVPTPDTADLFGVEVELEGINVVSQASSLMKYWKHHQDHSLRVHKAGAQAIEYVLGQPRTLPNTQAAIKVLFEYLNGPGVEVFKSYRTSIHIHINCLQETIRTVLNYLTLCIVFDELLTSQNGDMRTGNNFCLRAKDAEGQITDLIAAITSFGNLGNIPAVHRYSSINMASLLKFGTVEFRSMECTTDYERVMHWIKTVQTLKESARKMVDPIDIISKFSSKGPLGFLVYMLGDQASKYMQVPGYQHMLRNGMRLAQDFAFCSDWKTPLPVTEMSQRSPFSKQSEFDKYMDEIKKLQQAQAQVVPKVIKAVKLIDPAPQPQQPYVPVTWDNNF